MCQNLAIWGASQVRLDSMPARARPARSKYSICFILQYTMCRFHAGRGPELREAWIPPTMPSRHHTFPPTCGRHNSGTSFRDNSIAFTIFWLIEERQEQIYKDYAHG